MKLAILGCGQMGENILKGLLRVQAVEQQDVWATTKFDDHEQELRTRFPKATVSQDNPAAAAAADVAILAVHPAAAQEVCTQVAPALEGKLLISICAGVPLQRLTQWLPGVNVVRMMPNTPCVIGEGAIVLSPAPSIPTDRLETARRLAAALGEVMVLDEKYMDVVTALAAAGPAFTFVILEALADGAVMMGLPREIAVRLSAQMMQGAARLQLATGLHPAALKDQVTTPGGITTAGLLVMEDGGIRSTLARTIQTAVQRAKGITGDQ